MWVEGLRVAFLAYDQVGPDWLWATDDAPGCAPMRIDQMAADVQAARRQADVVVVVCHWGYEYSAYATASQQDAARALGEAGAALVIGGHAHVVQGVEYQDHTFVAYGWATLSLTCACRERPKRGWCCAVCWMPAASRPWN